MSQAYVEPEESLEQVALAVREHVIRMATRGGCFIGASLSCTVQKQHQWQRPVAKVVGRDPQTVRQPLAKEAMHNNMNNS